MGRRERERNFIDNQEESSAGGRERRRETETGRVRLRETDRHRGGETD
jgi:hypothetical protein